MVVLVFKGALDVLPPGDTVPITTNQELATTSGVLEELCLEELCPLSNLVVITMSIQIEDFYWAKVNKLQPSCHHLIPVQHIKMFFL